MEKRTRGDIVRISTYAPWSTRRGIQLGCVGQSSFTQRSIFAMELPKVESNPATPVNQLDPKAESKVVESVIDMSDTSSARKAEEAIQERGASGTPKTVRWSPELVSEAHYTDRSADFGYGRGSSNPYVAPSPVEDPSASIKEKAIDTMINVKDVLGRWGKKVGEATKKAEDLAGNTWQHLKTAPSFADAAMGRIAQGTKVLAEGGYEKIFRNTFDTIPDEKLVDSFACYLSTSAGPVMGAVYVSTAKLAFCSDSPLSYKSGDQTEWSYYKVVIPLHQLKAVNPSTSRGNGAEKYIQVVSVDDHEFWYMGFLNYTSAVKCFQDALENSNMQHV